METGLLVGGGKQGGLLAAVGKKGSGKVKLETLGEVVLSLNLSLQDVGSGPSLSEDEAVGLVRVLGLNVGVDVVGLGVLDTKDLERDIGRSRGLDLELGTTDLEITAQKVVGGFTEILQSICYAKARNRFWI